MQKEPLVAFVCPAVENSGVESFAVAVEDGECISESCREETTHLCFCLFAKSLYVVFRSSQRKDHLGELIRPLLFDVGRRQ